jgi:hypothetical protein
MYQVPPEKYTPFMFNNNIYLKFYSNGITNISNNAFNTNSITNITNSAFKQVTW